jgi:hypothetical protein
MNGIFDTLSHSLIVQYTHIWFQSVSV